MLSRFTKKIAPHVKAQIALAVRARAAGNSSLEFQHYENAHVLGQESTYWHVKTHILMLGWALRNSRLREFLGQLFRVTGAATKTVFGLVPKGNTGGANVSPFKAMPIDPSFQAIIDSAKTDS